MARPDPGSRWVRRDAVVSAPAYEQLMRCDLPRMLPAYAERPFTEDPMQDVILLFAALVRRRTALAVAMALEDPELVSQVIQDTITFDCSPDTRGMVFETWEDVLPEDIILDALALHDCGESDDADDDAMEACDGLDRAA